jgi:hypothetical protein
LVVIACRHVIAGSRHRSNTRQSPGGLACGRSPCVFTAGQVERAGFVSCHTICVICGWSIGVIQCDTRVEITLLPSWYHDIILKIVTSQLVILWDVLDGESEVSCSWLCVVNASMVNWFWLV